MDEKDILLKEWEKNVDLYIDQDKRGFERIKMFLLIHAGLFALYGTIYSGDDFDSAKRFLLCLVAAVGLYIARVTKQMSIRAHSYIHLRRVQGMLIEEKLEKLLSKKNGSEEKKTTKAPTTFTREHIAFAPIIEKGEAKWTYLKEEIKELSEYAANSFKVDFDKYVPIYKLIKKIKCYQRAREWYKKQYKSIFEEDLRPTIGHLAWLIRIYVTLYVLWAVLFIFALIPTMNPNSAKVIGYDEPKSGRAAACVKFLEDNKPSNAFIMKVKTLYEQPAAGILAPE